MDFRLNQIKMPHSIAVDVNLTESHLNENMHTKEVLPICAHESNVQYISKLEEKPKRGPTEVQYSIS